MASSPGRCGYWSISSRSLETPVGTLVESSLSPAQREALEVAREQPIRRVLEAAMPDADVQCELRLSDGGVFGGVH
jgi:hypothetical protein